MSLILLTSLRSGRRNVSNLPLQSCSCNAIVPFSHVVESRTARISITYPQRSPPLLHIPKRTQNENTTRDSQLNTLVNGLEYERRVGRWYTQDPHLLPTRQLGTERGRKGTNGVGGSSTGPPALHRDDRVALFEDTELETPRESISDSVVNLSGPHQQGSERGMRGCVRPSAIPPQ